MVTQQGFINTAQTEGRTTLFDGFGSGAEGVNTYIHHSDRTTLQRCLYMLERFSYDLEIKGANKTETTN